MSVGLIVPGVPGVRAALQAVARNIFVQGDEKLLALGRMINGAKSRDPLNTGAVNVLRAGLLMGKISASGLFAPSILGLTLNAEAIASIAVEVSPATAVELVRRVGTSGTFKLTGPPTAATTVVTETVTYSSVNTTTGVIAVTALVNAFVAGSLVQPTDGSETILTFVPDPYGILATSEDGQTDLTVEFPRLPIGGTIDPAQLLNWPTDTSTRTFIRTALSTLVGGKFVFSDTY